MMKRLFRRPLFTGFSPNITWGQVVTACSFLFLPWRWSQWKTGEAVGEVESWLRYYMGARDVVTFDSGRSSLFFALQSLGVGSGDEVLVQAYTCVVVINAIRWTGARPVYVDVGDDFNMDPTDVQKKMTPRSKVLIIQHTFGQPAKLTQLLNFAQTHNLKTVEDCAHSLGATYTGAKLGTRANIGVLSFGSDKVVSCARGGAAITNDEVLAQRLREIQSTLAAPPLKVIIQHLLHFPFFWFGRLTYAWGVGKWVLGIAKRYFIMSRVLWPEEKKGQPTSFFPSTLPNALARLLLPQLLNLERVNEHRRTIAQMYNELLNNNAITKPLLGHDQNCIYLRYPILVNEPILLRQKAAKKGVFLGDWYDTPLAPKDIDMLATGYVTGMCPKAEFLSQHSLNLPTNVHIQPKDVQRILQSFDL